ncbi:hypothetical protein M9458_021970, partial [Cirrhinus mrigala]
VMGMMKGTKIGVSNSKGCTGASNLYPDNSMKCNSTSAGSQLKGKMRLQSEGGPKANAWKPGGLSSLADGFISKNTISNQMNCKKPNNPGEIYSVEEQDDGKQRGDGDQNNKTGKDRLNETSEEDEEMIYMRY